MSKNLLADYWLWEVYIHFNGKLGCISGQEKPTLDTFSGRVSSHNSLENVQNLLLVCLLLFLLPHMCCEACEHFLLFFFKILKSILRGANWNLVFACC